MYNQKFLHTVDMLHHNVDSLTTTSLPVSTYARYIADDYSHRSSLNKCRHFSPATTNVFSCCEFKVFSEYTARRRRGKKKRQKYSRILQEPLPPPVYPRLIRLWHNKSTPKQFGAPKGAQGDT